MATILSYLIEYKSATGEFLEAEVNVDYNSMKALSHSKALDETARRHIIAAILKEGGVVVKIRKM